MNGDDLNIANYGMCCKVLCRHHITYHILNNEPTTANHLSLLIQARVFPVICGGVRLSTGWYGGVAVGAKALW